MTPTSPPISTASSASMTAASSRTRPRPPPSSRSRRPSVLSYVLRDLLRNPRRTLASVAGVALAVGLFSGIAFFVDSSSSQMTARAIAPVVIDMQAGLIRPLAAPPDPSAPDLVAIRRSIESVSGVFATQPFALVALPAGSLHAGTAVINQPVKVVAFDSTYLKTFPAITVPGGQLKPGAALLSQSAWDGLAAAPGKVLQVAVPRAVAPLQLPVAGVADFSSPAATQLFASRNPDRPGGAS